MSLKVAFFGSDMFSIYMLNALVRCQKAHPGSILQLDVITRSIKPKGPKKRLIEYPVADIAKELNLNVYRAESKQDFEDIQNKLNPDIAIAASYGKLIPLKFISNLKYGGLNVHPSLLPKWSGPSPIQYTLTNDDKICGSTVQTLHATKFDHGDLIAQSNPPLPVSDSDNFDLLLEKLGQDGAKLLTKTIVDKLYLKTPLPPVHSFSHAPLIQKQDHIIDWLNHTSRKLMKLSAGLGFIQAELKYVTKNKKLGLIDTSLQVFLSDVDDVSNQDVVKPHGPVGSFIVDGNRIIVKTQDGFIAASKIKIQCYNWGTVNQFIKVIKKISANEVTNQFY